MGVKLARQARLALNLQPSFWLCLLPPYQAEWFRDSYKATKQRSCEVGIWRQAGSGIWVPHFWPVCLCDLVEFAGERHLWQRGMLSRLPWSHLCLDSSLESAFIHLALEVRGTSLPVILSTFQRRKAPLGRYQQTVAQLLELPMWRTPAPSFSLGASVERAYEAWASSPLWWSRAMLWQDCILSSVRNLFFGEYKASN